MGKNIESLEVLTVGSADRIKSISSSLSLVAKKKIE